MRQDGERLCFTRGWPEFAKAHDLRIGYLVVFRHEGKMVFTVKVFDTTCCLKDYPSIPFEPPASDVEPSEDVDVISVSSEGNEALFPPFLWKFTVDLARPA